MCVYTNTNHRQVVRVEALLPLLVAAFRFFLQKVDILYDWKVATLTPINKKGLPQNYRMIAVSGVFYRVFAGCVNDMIMLSVCRNRNLALC